MLHIYTKLDFFVYKSYKLKKTNFNLLLWLKTVRFDWFLFFAVKVSYQLFARSLIEKVCCNR